MNIAPWKGVGSLAFGALTIGSRKCDWYANRDPPGRGHRQPVLISHLETARDGRCEAIDVQAATLTNGRHMRRYYQELQPAETIIKSLDEMLLDLENA